MKPPFTVRFALRNRIDESARLARRVQAFGRRLGLTDRRIHAINLALEEIFTNIVSYGFPQGGEHRIRFALSWGAGTVTLRVSDGGTPFNPIEAPAPDLVCQLENERIGGLGIHLTRHMVERMHYQRRQQRNRLTMTMRVDAGA
jgi:anti-sigma regulatory factor (Ser/Thr protein kinase)